MDPIQLPKMFQMFCLFVHSSRSSPAFGTAILLSILYTYISVRSIVSSHKSVYFCRCCHHRVWLTNEWFAHVSSADYTHSLFHSPICPIASPIGRLSRDAARRKWPASVEGTSWIVDISDHNWKINNKQKQIMNENNVFYEFQINVPSTRAKAIGYY